MRDTMTSSSGATATGPLLRLIRAKREANSSTPHRGRSFSPPRGRLGVPRYSSDDCCDQRAASQCNVGPFPERPIHHSPPLFASHPPRLPLCRSPLLPWDSSSPFLTLRFSSSPPPHPPFYPNPPPFLSTLSPLGASASSARRFCNHFRCERRKK